MCYNSGNPLFGVFVQFIPIISVFHFLFLVDKCNDVPILEPRFNNPVPIVAAEEPYADSSRAGHQGQTAGTVS